MLTPNRETVVDFLNYEAISWTVSSSSSTIENGHLQ